MGSVHLGLSANAVQKTTSASVFTHSYGPHTAPTLRSMTRYKLGRTQESKHSFCSVKASCPCLAATHFKENMSALGHRLFSRVEAMSGKALGHSGDLHQRNS